MLVGGQRGRVEQMLTEVSQAADFCWSTLRVMPLSQTKLLISSCAFGCFGLAVVISEHQPEVRAIFFRDVAADAETLGATDLVGDVVTRELGAHVEHTALVEGANHVEGDRLL